MRIAISGTHSSGKSTLIDDFLEAHRDYLHEPEPYEWLEEIGAEEPTAEDFRRQLEICVDRWRGYERGMNVIGERSPLDFLAYILALNDLERSGRDCAMLDSAAELAAAGLANIDLLIILPLEQPDPLAPHPSEDLELREAMNERLLDLVMSDPYSLIRTRVVEVTGSREQRLRLVERALAR